MKKSLLKLWLASVAMLMPASSTFAADYVTEVLADAPVVYLRFEETTGTTAFNIGSLGATHNATYGGGFTLGQPGAITGNAMNGSVRLDGTSGHVLLNNVLSPGVFSDGNYSVELWFNQPTAAATQDLVSGVNPAGAVHGILLETVNGPALRFLHRSPSGNSGGQNINPSAETYTAGEWHHLVAVVENGDMNLYLDGVLDANSGVATSNDINFAIELVLGRLQPANSDRSFNGFIDEFAVYDYALSQERVLAHFNNASTVVPEPAALAGWCIAALCSLVFWGYARRRRHS